MSYLSFIATFWQIHGKLRHICVFLLFMVAASWLWAAEDGVKVINGRMNHKQMSNAVQPSIYMRIPVVEPSTVAARKVAGVSVGDQILPPAFRLAENGSVWILDSAGSELRLYTSAGLLAKTIGLSGLGRQIIDFALASDGSFAFLDDSDGYVIFADSKGKRVNEIEGLARARKIEFADRGDLHVDFPAMRAVLRFSRDGELVEESIYKDGLSLFTSPHGDLYGLNIRGSEAFLYKRAPAVAAGFKVMLKLKCGSDQSDVIYSDGEVVGTDRFGNIYLRLVAADKSGNVHQDRLYRVTAEGQVSSETDIIVKSRLDLKVPRTFVVAPEGKVFSIYVEGHEYILCTFALP